MIRQNSCEFEIFNFTQKMSMTKMHANWWSVTISGHAANTSRCSQSTRPQGIWETRSCMSDPPPPPRFNLGGGGRGGGGGEESVARVEYVNIVVITVTACPPPPPPPPPMMPIQDCRTGSRFPRMLYFENCNCKWGLSFICYSHSKFRVFTCWTFFENFDFRLIFFSEQLWPNMILAWISEQIQNK